MNRSSSHDFDFLFGSWDVRHRRLKERLANCNDWENFTGTNTAQPVLGGSGNIDDNLLRLPSGSYRAVTLRSFDSETGLWAIWWLDQRRPHSLDVPVVGAFDNDVGTFLADDMLDGRPIKVRFVWSDIAPNSCRWQQAFSADGGTSWETNWIMDFARSADRR